MSKTALLARLSLIFWPRRCSRFFRRLADNLTAGRLQASSPGIRQLSLERPCHIVGPQYMHIDRLTARPGLRLECIDRYGDQTFSPRLEIGAGVFFNFNVHVGVIDRISIGDNVLVGSNVLITDHGHGRTDRSELGKPPVERALDSKGPVTIEENVWIGENVCILPGVHIGRGSVIGAGAVVTRDIPEFSVAAGNPARIIRSLK